MESAQIITNSIDLTVSSKRILIVEDDMTMEPLWAYILEKVDKRNAYEWVASEAEAERKIENSLLDGRQFDLVISDIFLSGTKTGIDLWRRFSDPLCGKIILMSAIAKIKFQNYLGYSATAPVYIQKPLDIHDCIETVYFMLHKKK
ncbi:MAG: response regulator [Bdellovibrionaceae bacterium]|nr:response regulator [Pseudobdellovibrionaceae bacterium]